MDGDGPPPGLVRGADGELQVDGTVLGHDERGLQGEFFDVAASDVVAGPDCQFDEGGAGEQDGVGENVV
jgi:hypothetical protein